MQNSQTGKMEAENYIDLVSAIMERRTRNERPLAFTHTYGCQGNVADGERINGLLDAMGFNFTDQIEKADFILYNTCAVREHAEDRVFGNVGALKHIKRRYPDTIIALCGCMMQQERVAQRIKNSFPYVGMVFGTHVIHRLPELLYRHLSGGKRVFEISMDDPEIKEELPVYRDRSVKAWLPIMYGCDNFCTYCIVPYVRGRERSREPAMIEREFRNIVSSGYKDVTLLGQNVNSYGRKENGTAGFPELLRTLDKVEGDYWLRFMTSHPKDCSIELLDAMKDCGHVARHLHLPCQSGSNEILHRMNRRYTREQYISLIDAARERMPDISITSDVIVGFPNETEQQFCETLDLIERIGFTSLYTFIYSAREGTPAAKMEDRTTREEKAERMNRLLRLQEAIAAKRCAKMVGSRYRALAEESPEEGVLCCRTAGNIMVEAAGDSAKLGSFVEVEITAARNWTLSGKII